MEYFAADKIRGQRLCKVEVALYDFNKKTISEGKVTLVAAKVRQEPLTLKFDKRTGIYSTNTVPGSYSLRVEASGLEAQQREVQVTPPGIKEIFILGKKGMPFYYKQNIQVPFEPKVDLLGIAVAPRLSEKQESELNQNARELGLKPEEVSAEIRASGVRVFRFTKELDNKQRQEIQEKIQRNPAVKRAGPIVFQEEQGLAILTNELVAKFNHKYTREEIQKITKELNLEIIRELPYIQNGFVLRSKAETTYGVLEICDSLVKREMVEYAEPNLIVTAIRNFTPNDTRYNEQPHHALIDSEAAWDLTRGDHNILIAVMDDGCDIDHEDLTNPPGTTWNKVINPFSFATYTNSPADTSHGTRSCGIATAVANNNLGVAGVAPGCQLMPLEWVSAGTITDWSDAYIWIAGGDPDRPAPFPAKLAKGADVISNSIGVTDFPMSGIMKDTWDYIATYGRNGRGCIVVFAAGNSNIDMSLDSYAQWANYQKTIAVSSCTISPPDTTETKVSTSSFGDGIDVCAPAGGPAGGTETRTLSTAISNTYATHGQTSCACPQVAGVAALMLSANPNLSWVTLRQLLRDTATHIDVGNVTANGIWRDENGTPSNAPGYLGPHQSKFYGFGRVNSHAAVHAALDLVGVDPLAHIDTWIKENTADIGNIPCLPPYSPDVWVRNVSPAMDDPAHVNEHQSPVRGQDNWVYINARNRGAIDSNDVYVRVMITRWAGTQYVYPDDFLPTVMPSTNPTVMAPGTYLIGEVHIDSIPASGSVTINTKWPKELIPPETVTVNGVTYSWADSCLLVEISPHDGPPPTGNHTWEDNNLCQRNVTIQNATTGTDTFDFAFVVGHRLNREEVFNLEIERQNLPAAVQMYVDFIDEERTRRIRQFLIEPQNQPRPLPMCELTILTQAEATLRCPETNKPVQVKISPNTNFRFPYCAFAKPIEYNLTPEELKEKMVFRLPTARKTYVPVLRGKEPYQIIAIRGKGLKGLRKGEYGINIYQEDQEGRKQGGINLIIRK